MARSIASYIVTAREFRQLRVVAVELGVRHIGPSNSSKRRYRKYEDIAETYRGRGDIATATAIYRALAETIRENMKRIDDSGGHYGREIERAVESYAETVVEADLDHEQKQSYIEYLFEQFVETDYAFASDYYDDALRTLCTTDADREYWLGLLDERVGGVDLNPTTLAEQTTSPTGSEQGAGTESEPEPSDDQHHSDEKPPTPTERTDDVLYTSDFTNGALTTDDFTAGTLDLST